MPYKFLAIDLGASSGRAMLGILNDNKLALEEIHRFSNDPVEIHGSLHWDILRLFFEIKQGLIKCANMGHKDILSIGVDTWGVDFGLLDESGRLIDNPYHYRDARTNGMIEELNKIIPAKELYDITGIQFMNLNTIYQLYALKKSNSRELRDAKSLLFTPDLINYFLTGQKACEYSIASTSALLDAEKRDFSSEILKKLDIPRSLFQDIVMPGTVIGSLTKDISSETGLGEISVIATGSHDTASALACVPTDSSDFAFLSSGTWSLMGMEINDPIISEESREMGFTNEGAAEGKIKYLTNIMGMWLIQECKRHWERKGTPYTYDELDQMAMEEQPFTCFVNPDDESFVAPKEMPEKIKAFCKKTGQSVPQTDGQIIRCIYDSLALKYKSVFHNLEKIAGKELSALHIVGGGIKNKPLCQMTANAIGKKVIAGPIEATAMGNILLQAKGMKALDSLADIRRVAANSTDLAVYAPQDSTAYDEAFSRFEKLI